MNGSLALRSGPLPAGDAGCLDLLPEVVVAVKNREGSFPGLSQQILHLGVSEQQEQTLNRLAVERLGAGGELVVDRPVALVGRQFPMLGTKLAPGFLEGGFDFVHRDAVSSVVEGQFDQPAAEIAPLDGPGGKAGERSFVGFGADDPQARRLRGQRDPDIQLPLGGPIEEPLGGVTPLHSEWRLENGLGEHPPAHEEKETEQPDAHAGTMAAIGRGNKRGTAGAETGRSRELPVRRGFVNFSEMIGEAFKSRRFRQQPRSSARRRRPRGMVLLEATYALLFVTGLALVLLKLSLNVVTPRQWTLQQSVTDAYLTYEKALAQRLPFADLLDTDSPWPAYPTKAEETVVLGYMPGGRAIEGKVIRTRVADSNNYAVDGGSGTLASNPSGMKVWNFQSLLVYDIGDRTYVKTRTVVRSQ